MDSDAVKEFIRREVPDWDDEVVSTARFKAFSGQRYDWEPKFQFWRDLILKVSRQFGMFIIDPVQVKNAWFERGGMTPLCVDHVLLLMHSEDDVVRISDLDDPCSGRISRLFRTVSNLVAQPSVKPGEILEDKLVIFPLLKEKAADVVNILSEGHWTSTCVVTLKKFRSLCNGSNEASAVLSHLSGCGKAHKISINRGELIEGVKVSISKAALPSISNLDCDILHLLRTTEKLQDQLEVMDQRCETSKKSALLSLKSGHKQVALRHARQLKLATESREKCTSLLNRVEEVLNAITDSESTKMVSEAIKTGAKVMKDIKISADEVHDYLEELEETIESQKEVEKALESAPYPDIDDENIEEELLELEMELESENSQVQPGISDTADSLTEMLSELKLGYTKQTLEEQATEPVRMKDTGKKILEPA
ncbi:PREDICTED: charged multivesicular body protein 7-like [Camelina sativa]|uniref:Charged multivesicular body protein 7-like n=1 Tax=Camelina sativa TaxID=90675 RepID=A0ABM0SM85_CAMSA|nr:PREDICTED: charged multivesicular body protein 7-like [Camelina sativa]